MECQECKIVFESNRSKQRFCCNKCKDAYHNREKRAGLMLTPVLRAELQELAVVHDISENEMACLIVHQTLNPGRRPLEDADIFGVQQMKQGESK